MSNMNNRNLPLRDRIRPNFIWITFVFLVWLVLLCGILHLYWEEGVKVVLPNLSNEMFFAVGMYASTIVDIIGLAFLCLIFSKNRYIWKSFEIPLKKRTFHVGDTVTEDDAYAELYGRSRNSLKMLAVGLMLGFLTNFFCILCALLHGDIKLYFDCRLSQIPYFLFALLCVCIQSSSEELWCRGFLYERLHERYPLWFAILLNGSIFGFLHIFNPGATALPIAGIIVCGISYSLLRWYCGNIWIAMGIHTGWNFTQNFLFGLPNSGLVSEASVFHLDAANGTTNLIYDWTFGVEGGLPALFIDALLGVIIIVLAYRNGRIKELGMNRIKALELIGLREHVYPAAPVEDVSPVVQEEAADASAVQEEQVDAAPAITEAAAGAPAVLEESVDASHAITEDAVNTPAVVEEIYDAPAAPESGSEVSGEIEL